MSSNLGKGNKRINDASASLMQLVSLQGCELKIGKYPRFKYDARGGGGLALVLNDKETDIKYLKFNRDTFSIPPLNWKTGKFLCMPLPPGIQIKMYLDKLEGTFNQLNGEISFNFESKFRFTIWPSFVFPDLIVKTFLTSGEAKGDLNETQGRPLQKDGNSTLVGIAIVPKTGHRYLDSFLNLPNEALAILKCKITSFNKTSN